MIDATAWTPGTHLACPPNSVMTGGSFLVGACFVTKEAQWLSAKLAATLLPLGGVSVLFWVYFLESVALTCSRLALLFP